MNILPHFDPLPEDKYLQGLSALCGVVLLSGCNTIDLSREPPSDFPKLTVSVVKADKTRCDRFGFLTLGCTRINFCAQECVITYVGELPGWLEEHERMHCKGYDHVGDSAVRDLFALYKHELHVYQTTGQIIGNACGPLAR